MDTLLYRQWRVFALVIFIIVAAGASAISTIPRQEDPTITNFFATIITPYPGASPARVEAQVTEHIERELAEIPEMDEVHSVSRNGISFINVALDWTLSSGELERVWSEVRDALSDAARNFPPGVPEPTFDNDRMAGFTTISAIQPAPGYPLNHSLLRRYAEILEERMQQLDGSKIVVVFGEQDEEILVEVDANTLTSMGITVDQVSHAIRNADAKVTAGQLRADTTNFLIEIAGEFKSVERVADIAVGTGPAGELVRVRDIAQVSRSVRSPPSGLAYSAGKPAVLIGTQMQSGLQVDQWIKTAYAEFEEFEADLPQGIHHELIFDQSVYTDNRLGNLFTNLMIGIGLVVTVLFFTLGWRGAFIVACLLPLTGLFSLSILNFIGLEIQQMSVSGIIVALGLLVDAAIVMTDEIRRRLKAGADRLDAVRLSVRRLVAPLMASTFTTVLAFTPMALLPGPAGDFVGSIALSVIVMLLVSFGLALTVTPALGGWMMVREGDEGSQHWWNIGIHPKTPARLFDRSLQWSMENRGLSILAACALPLIGFLSFPTLTAQFFPGEDRNQFHVQIELPATASIVETDRYARLAAEIVADDAGVTKLAWVVGESAPAFYYNMIRTRDQQKSYAQLLVTTRSNEDADRLIPLMQQKLDTALPQAQIIVRNLTQGPPVESPLEIKIAGPDLITLRDLGDKVREKMARVPGITHTKASLIGGEPKISFLLNEDDIRGLGLDLRTVAGQLESALEGATGGSLLEATEELPVRVRLGEDERASVDLIRSLKIVPPAGSPLAASGDHPGIPLAALGRAELVPSESPIARENSERVNIISGYIETHLLPETALTGFQRLWEQEPVYLPPGYRLIIGGDADARADTVSNLVAPMGLVMTLTIATIVLTFNSFTLFLISFIVVLLSAGLSIFSLAVFDYPFGIQAMIGVIGSIGVSINAAIIILTALQQDDRAMANDVVRIRQIVGEASRHIISTTTTTFGGFLPLIIAGGGFWPPFAMAIAGGVLLSSFVSFYFTPPMFSLLVARGHRTHAEPMGLPAE